MNYEESSCLSHFSPLLWHAIGKSQGPIVYTEKQGDPTGLCDKGTNMGLALLVLKVVR